MIEVILNENQAGRRFDKFLHSYMKKAPHTLIYKLLRKKRIKLNGQRAEGKEITAAGDRVAFYLAPETLHSFMPEPAAVRNYGPVDIIFEDKNVILANKPAGLLTHSDKPGSQDTLVDRLAYYIKESGADPQNIALSNRLDRNTSGLVACGKNMAAIQALNAIFAARKVEKTYLAVVCGRLEGKGNLYGYLHKDEKTNRSYILDQMQDNAAFVHTEYENLKHLNFDKSRRNDIDCPTAFDVCLPDFSLLDLSLVDLSLVDLSLVKVKLHTGRPHQIRAHLASIGHPLVGDTKYGGHLRHHTETKQSRSGQMLHCHSMKFLESETALSYLVGQEWTAPIPDDMILRSCIQPIETLS